MVELTIFVAAVILLGAMIVKLFEWRQDVLHGPYIARRRDAHNAGQQRKKAI
jgi:hypothetical protein